MSCSFHSHHKVIVSLVVHTKCVEGKEKSIAYEGSLHLNSKSVCRETAALRVLMAEQQVTPHIVEQQEQLTTETETAAQVTA